MPNGPAGLGPMRFCMSAMTLRSNQIISIVATSRNAKTTTTFSRTISTTARSTLAAEERVTSEHRDRLRFGWTGNGRPWGRRPWWTAKPTAPRRPGASSWSGRRSRGGLDVQLGDGTVDGDEVADPGVGLVAAPTPPHRGARRCRGARAG